MNRLRHYHYLLSTLVSLEPIGSIPPISKAELLERVIGSNGPAETVRMILLSDDLTQYEALLVEEVKPDKTDFAVLSLDKAENEPVLPDFLISEEPAQEKDNRRLSVDAIWSRYFRQAALVAKRTQSSFFKAWIGFEVGLRNALVAARAQILELDFAAYLVAPELADKDTDYGVILSAWTAASNPLAALEVLDKTRWDWLEEHGRWYSFSASEIEVYAAKLILLHRWRRIMSDTHDRHKSTVAQLRTREQKIDKT